MDLAQLHPAIIPKGCHTVSFDVWATHSEPVEVVDEVALRIQRGVAQLRSGLGGDVELRPVRGGDLMLSIVGLGGFELGPNDAAPPDAARALALVNAAIDAGINWIDTSENYLETRNESLIGETLSRASGAPLVATKVAPDAAVTGGGSGFRPNEIHAACRSSLRRLGRGHIDLYFLHWPTEQDVPLSETWGAMSELVEVGLVRAIGMSNYELSDIEQCHRQRAGRRHPGRSLIDRPSRSP